MQKTGFLALLPHKKLPEVKTLTGNSPDTDQKGISPSTPGKTSRLRIEESQLRRRAIGNRAARDRVEQIAGKFRERRKVETSMPPMPFPQPLRLEVRPESRLDDVALEKFLGIVTLRPERRRKSGNVRLRRRRSSGRRILPVDPGNPLAKRCELFLDIEQMRSPFLCLVYYASAGTGGSALI